MYGDGSPKKFKRRRVVNTNQDSQNGERKINETGLTREQAMSAGLPARWMYCPKYGEVIENLFFPMKTPLSEGYDDLLETQYRFHPEDVFKIQHPNNLRPKIWISLANTERFYGRKQITDYGCEYIHLPMVGHDEAPTEEDVKRFLRIANGFYNKNEPGLIILHCTHGFNRTGFLIAAALVELFGFDAEAALAQFAKARPHGIYKEDYIREFFIRYDSTFDKDGPLPYDPPGRPAWEDGPDSDLAYESMMNSGSTTTQINDFPKFMDGAVPNCSYIIDPEQRTYLQGKVRDYVVPFTPPQKKLKNEFPGSQPVSMDNDNLILIAESQYWVSWKADGMRYLVLINDENEVFAFDRDNNVFELPLKFPRHDNLDEHVTDTLIDCEVTLDKQEDGSIRPRMLIYDIIVFQKQEVGKKPFNKRLGYIQQFIDEPRRKAQSVGKIREEVMSVRLKQFYYLEQTPKVFQMSAGTGHHVDGLIFQPEDDPYTPGRFDRLLKWKPVEESSIDFKMVIKKYSLQAQLPEYRAELYVLGMPAPFAFMKATKTLQAYDGKIIECCWDFERNTWKFMRERTDKSHPNALATAKSVMNTIRHPLHKEKLLAFIHNFGFRPGHPIRLPPTQHNGGHNGRIHDRTQLTSMVL